MNKVLDPVTERKLRAAMWDGTFESKLAAALEREEKEAKMNDRPEAYVHAEDERWFIEKSKEVPCGSAQPVRTFATGATRDTDQGKFDYEGFLSPWALEAYAKYMHKNRVQSDGNLRDSDNWQKGIPVEQYMKSMFRHFMAVWKGHRSGAVDLEDLCALLFNAMGMLHELRKPRAADRGTEAWAPPSCKPERAPAAGRFNL